MPVAKTYRNPPQANRLESEKIKPSCILPIERFDHRQGLTSLQIHKAVCSLDGRIWCATPAGLACYDGVSISMFGQKHGLSNHGLRTLAIHPDNSLWIGTDIGIEVLDISGPELKVMWSAQIGTVNSLDVVQDLAVMGTSNGLIFVRGDWSIQRSAENSLSHAIITSVMISADGDVWVIGPAIGVVGLTPLEEIKKFPQRLRMIGAALCLAEGPEGSILIGAEKGVLHLEKSAEIRQFYTHNKPITALTYHDQNIFASTGKNLIRIDTNKPTEKSYDIIHEDVVAHHILIDHFQNIWISSGDQSLLRISGITQTLSGNYDLEIGPILSVRKGPNGLLIGGSRGLRLENGTVILEQLGIWDTLVDEFGKVWCATNRGLYCMVNPYFSIPYRHDENDVVAAPCRSLCFYQGILYVSSIRGLARIVPQGPQELLDEDGESLGYVYSLHVGPKGHLWIATLGRGLWRLDGTRLERMYAKQMPDNVNVYALCHSNAGEVYIAHDNWISKINTSGQVSRFIDTGEPIAAWSIQYLPENQLVAGASTGLTIYNATTGQIERKLSGNFDDVPWEFTTSRSLTALDENTVYCGLGSGLRTVHLQELAKLYARPEASLSYVNWRGVKPNKDQRDNCVVKTGNWHLEIGIRTCWYLDVCVMRERLLGFEDDWSPYHSLQAVKFTSLQPGTYELEVEVYSPLAGAGPANSVFSFEVRG